MLKGSTFFAQKQIIQYLCIIKRDKVKRTLYTLYIIIASIFTCTITAHCGSITTITGRVLLEERDTLPGDYVMVYAKDFSTGVLSDEHGNFSLNLKANSGEKTTLEFSRIGYSMITLDVTLSGEKETLNDILLQPQPLMLMAAYVSDDSRSPSEIILSKLWARSKEINQNPFDYMANVEYEMSTHEIPIVARSLPKILTGAFKLYMGHQGYGPLVRYCMTNDDFSAKAIMTRQVKDGVKTDCGCRITYSDQPLPSNVQDNVKKMLQYLDFFDVMYGYGNEWGEKFSDKHKFTLTGTYEWGDHIVDVLSHTDRHNRSTAVIHVVEDEWMILKLQLLTKEGEVFRCEARDVGNGIFMPISLVLKPSVTMIRAEQIPGLIQSIENDKNISKKAKARMIKALREKEGHDFNPYISVAGNVKYRLL